MYYKYIKPSDQYIINIGTCALCGGVTRASGLQSKVTRAKWHHSWLFELTRTSGSIYLPNIIIFFIKL